MSGGKQRFYLNVLSCVNQSKYFFCCDLFCSVELSYNSKNNDSTRDSFQMIQTDKDCRQAGKSKGEGTAASAWTGF